MNRRTAIRNAVIISAGAGLLPSCIQQDKGSINLKNISISGAQQDFLAELAETIIPKSKNFIGAKDLKAHEFVLTMVDDCSSPEDQEKFVSGMKQFEDACKKKWDHSFVKCTAQEKNETLNSAEKKKELPEDAVRFYGTVKRYTLETFATSERYLTDIRKFKLVPGGDFKGCVPV